MDRHVLAWYALTLSVGAMNGQISTPFPGSEVRGYVSAAFSTARGPVKIALPGVHVFLAQASGGAAVPSSSVFTDIRGHFRIPKVPDGKYRVCADSPSFAPGCAADTIEISNNPV